MHCPTCRHDNASTTRFCTACGAVLVESVRGVGRRRVLRPWGLRRAAPATTSPDMPELAAMHRGIARRSGWPARKLGVFLVGGIAVTAVAGTLVYPYAAPHEEVPRRADPPIVLLEIAPAPPPVQETVLRAPPLVELNVPARKESRQRHVVRETSPPAPAEAPPPTPDIATPPPAAVEPAPPAPVTPPPAAPVDRFDPLRNALRSCAARDGVFERATCEQRARIDHCAGYWDQAPLCPSGRREHTQ
jgi:hypothetical protein